MFWFLWACAEPTVSVWGKMDTGEASVEWEVVSFHVAGTPWNDPWIDIPLLNDGEMLLTTQKTLIAEGTLPEQEYHHVFTDAAKTMQDGESLEDIIEQIAAPFYADATYNIVVEYIVLDQNIFAKDCKVQLEWL